MEQKELSRSQQKIQKMNSSMISFRQLIESLRVKNQQLVKPSVSQANPQSQNSSVSRLCASEKIGSNNDHAVPVIQNIPIITTYNGGIPNNSSGGGTVSMVAAVPVQDEGIRLKARGHVAGRDVLNRNVNLVPPSKFNETVVNNKQHARNKNIELNNSYVNQKNSQLPSIQQLKILMSKHASNKERPAQILEMQPSKTSTNFNKTMTTMPLTRPKFQQNRLNLKALNTRNKLKDIDENQVTKYYKETKQLKQISQAYEIFEYFQGLMNVCNVAIVSPFIKKFKNCVYFGNNVLEDDAYEGFLYFYDGKIYYGDFVRNQKNGKGVEIMFEDQVVYKGIFKDGQKTGKFWVKKPEESYIGLLQRGLYHGQGKLQTKQSIYQGQFENGEKHGFGQQFYPKTGVKMTGYFDHGIFSKRSKSSFSHSQIQKAIKFKIPKKSQKQILRKRNSSGSSRIISDECEGTNFGHNMQPQNQMGLYVPPFSTSSNSFNHKKALFNKQKIRTYLPGMSGHKFVDPMPENCRDYDYSFDVSSRKDTDQFSQLGQLSYGKANRLHQERERKGTTILPFSQIQQQKHHLDTSALEDPLPMPCFYKK